MNNLGERYVPCPMCAAGKDCMHLCDGKGKVDLEELGRTLAMEERAEAFAESGGGHRSVPPISEKWWAAYRAHFWQVAREHVATLAEIYKRTK